MGGLDFGSPFLFLTQGYLSLISRPMNRLSAKYKECLSFYDGDVAFSAETDTGQPIIAMAIPDAKWDKDAGLEGSENARDHYYVAFRLNEDVAAEYERGRLCFRSAVDHPETRFFTCDQMFFGGQKGDAVEFVEVGRPDERDLPAKGLFSDVFSWITIEKKEQEI